MRYLSQVPDGAIATGGGDASAEVDPSADDTAAPPELHKSSQCYTCKARFTTLHHFYAQLCPGCAALNYRMRHAAADLSGRVALLTGARVKIGLQIGLKLLRAGATLVATSRFPADMARRYAEEPDFPEWRHRLQLHAADLRGVHSRGSATSCSPRCPASTS